MTLSASREVTLTCGTADLARARYERLLILLSGCRGVVDLDRQLTLLPLGTALRVLRLLRGDVGDGIPGVVNADEQQQQRRRANQQEARRRVPLEEEGRHQQRHVRDERKGAVRSEERRVGKGVDLGGRRIIKKKK